MQGFPITRQGLLEIATVLLVGIAVFAVLAFVRRRRGGDARPFVQAIAALAGLTGLVSVLAFTVAPNIPTPPVPFTARFANNPVPDGDASIDSGRRLYQANCAICHGPRAKGDGPAAFTLNPRPFDLQVHVPLHPTGEVFYWISEGVAGTGMPAWKDRLSAEERWQIIRYIDALAAGRIAQ
ncbi:MAG TPA: c-type cytochrome [Candidatus Limnocylindria bacterium]|nr:c-type cytochrome [Candidatus Limnocylindria bacterium]